MYDTLHLVVYVLPSILFKDTLRPLRHSKCITATLYTYGNTLQIWQHSTHIATLYTYGNTLHLWQHSTHMATLHRPISVAWYVKKT